MYQLNLPIQLRPEADFGTFVIGPNAEAVAAITAWSSGDGDDFLYLFSDSGSGKTHLLQAACRKAVKGGRSAIYLPLKHDDLVSSVLHNLELWDLVAVDDIQAIAGNGTWETGLCDLFNRLRESKRRLVVSADGPAANLPLTLADLRSRLGWGPGYRLLPLDESDCTRLLIESAERRGLTLGRDAVDYIMRRCPREPRYLTELLEEIDQESLRKQRRPSLWLVRQIVTARSEHSTP